MIFPVLKMPKCDLRLRLYPKTAFEDDEFADVG